MAVTPLLVGVWATASPRGFYDQFPGAGHHWVSAVGAYDEHLVRDVGALYLGSLVLLALTWAWLDRRLVQAALISYAVAALPHLIYHLTALDGFSVGDGVAELWDVTPTEPPRVARLIGSPGTGIAAPTRLPVLGSSRITVPSARFVTHTKPSPNAIP